MDMSSIEHGSSEMEKYMGTCSNLFVKLVVFQEICISKCIVCSALSKSDNCFCHYSGWCWEERPDNSAHTEPVSILALVQ